jgi:hypothetical protein
MGRKQGARARAHERASKQHQHDKTVIDHLIGSIGTPATDPDSGEGSGPSGRRRFGQKDGHLLEEATRRESRRFPGGLPDF